MHPIAVHPVDLSVAHRLNYRRFIVRLDDHLGEVLRRLGVDFFFLYEGYVPFLLRLV